MNDYRITQTVCFVGFVIVGFWIGYACSHSDARTIESRPILITPHQDFGVYSGQ